MYKKVEMYQEVEIKFNMHFTKPRGFFEIQMIFEQDVKYQLEHRNDYHWNETPMTVDKLETSYTNMHITVTTAIDAKYNEPDISRIVAERVKNMLAFGINSYEVMSIREEAEIYGTTPESSTKFCSRTIALL